MADCELLKGCLFFNDKMSDQVGMGAIYKKAYCLGDSSKCARFVVAKALGRENVPANLYPNMANRACQIIEDASS